jgi:hypothetical protein
MSIRSDRFGVQGEGHVPAFGRAISPASLPTLLLGGLLLLIGP